MRTCFVLFTVLSLLLSLSAFAEELDPCLEQCIIKYTDAVERNDCFDFCGDPYCETNCDGNWNCRAKCRHSRIISRKNNPEFDHTCGRTLTLGVEGLWRCEGEPDYCGCAWQAQKKYDDEFCREFYMDYEEYQSWYCHLLWPTYDVRSSFCHCMTFLMNEEGACQEGVVPNDLPYNQPR